MRQSSAIISPPDVAKPKADLFQDLPALSKFKGLYQTLGPNVCLILFFGILTGVSVSFVELGFAYGLQSFFVAIGITSLDGLLLTKFLPLNSLTAVVSYLLIVGSLRSVVLWLNSALTGLAQARFTFEQRHRFSTWVFRRKNVSPSEVMSVFNEHIQQSGLAVKYLQDGLINLSTAVSLAVKLCLVSPQLSAVALVILGGLSIPSTIMNRISASAGKGIRREWDKVNRHFMLGIRNLLFLRIHRMEDEQENRSTAALADYYRHSLRHIRIAATQSVLPQLLGVFLICFLAFKGKADKISPAVLLCYFYLLARCLRNASGTTSNLSGFFFLWPQLESLIQWTQGRGDVSKFDGISAPVVELVPKITTPIGWELKQVSFCYQAGAPWVLKDLNLTIPMGATTVITGPSGAGKSTLLNLLIGELDPGTGTVCALFNEGLHPVSGVKKGLLDRIGYVSANDFIIEGSVRDNLCFGLSFVPTDEAIEQVLIQAECHFLLDGSQGLSTMLWENGEGLSSGQRQRLSLARALLRAPKALILDEATSNVDNVTEQKLVETLGKLKSQFTIVAVTHREALLAIADHHVELKPR